MNWTGQSKIMALHPWAVTQATFNLQAKYGTFSVFITDDILYINIRRVSLYRAMWG